MRLEPRARQHLPDRRRGTSLVLSLLLAGLIVPLMVAGSAGFRLNLTSSIPLGLYKVAGSQRALKRGDVVLACLPDSVAGFARDRGYVPGGGSCPKRRAPVGKLVMALPGDIVAVLPTGLSVNGVMVGRSRPLLHDRSGRALPRVPCGRSLVEPHTLWLIGSSEHSFDSRYFGPVPDTNVIARVRRF